MAKRLFVGNLSYNVTQGQLEEMFAQAGKVVSVSLITDKQTGRSKGFAFVEMETEEEAQNAIQTLNGKDFEGRPLVVNEARPQEERPRSYGSGGYNSGHSNSGGYNKNRY